MEKQNCKEKVEVFSRVVGFYRPVQVWNEGKKEEFKCRVPFEVNKDVVDSIKEKI